MRRLAILWGLLALIAAPLAAEERHTLGWGRLLNNDLLGDGRDRWRTSSYMLALVRGPDWQGMRPVMPGALLEYRLRAEIIAPRRLAGPTSTDRPFAGTLSAGIHTHWQQDGWDISAGLDLVVLGPQTGLEGIQTTFHNLFDAPVASDWVIANQVGNDILLAGSAEFARPVRLSDTLSLRPFVDLQAGAEDVARIGIDLLVGDTGQRALKLRDPVTGHLLHAVTEEDFGWSFAFGADYARIWDSVYLPAEFGTVARDERWRVRAGAHWQGGAQMSFFYGVTWLSEEFVSQEEPQLVGSLKLNFNF